jgi:hypothetical protein
VVVGIGNSSQTKITIQIQQARQRLKHCRGYEEEHKPHVRVLVRLFRFLPLFGAIRCARHGEALQSFSDERTIKRLVLTGCYPCFKMVCYLMNSNPFIRSKCLRFKVAILTCFTIAVDAIKMS